MSRQPRYGLGEIRRLVEGYEAVLERRDTTEVGLRALVAVADIRRAIYELPWSLRRAVLVHGVHGLSGPHAAAVLGIGTAAVYYRYHAGLRLMQRQLNGR
jgi:DNA-directed RNA polymerase specialized sigma24 family protein